MVLLQVCEHLHVVIQILQILLLETKSVKLHLEDFLQVQTNQLPWGNNFTVLLIYCTLFFFNSFSCITLLFFHCRYVQTSFAADATNVNLTVRGKPLAAQVILYQLCMYYSCIIQYFMSSFEFSLFRSPKCHLFPRIILDQHKLCNTFSLVAMSCDYYERCASHLIYLRSIVLLFV